MKKFIGCIVAIALICGISNMGVNAEESIVEEKGVIKNGELYVSGEKIANRDKINKFIEEEYELCFDATYAGYKDITPQKGKEALVTVERYGGIIYDIQNGSNEIKDLKVYGYKLDLKDTDTKNWICGEYYDHLIDGVEAASVEWSYDIYSAEIEQNKNTTLDEYEVGEDTEYKYMYTVNPLIGEVSKEDSLEVESIAFSTTGSDYAFTVNKTYTDEVANIMNDGVYREVEENDKIESKVVNINDIDYTSKIAVESFAPIYIMNLGELSETELAIGLENKKVYSMSSIIKADGTYSRSVQEIGGISDINLSNKDIILEVENNKIIAVVNKYSEIVDGNLIGRTYTIDEMYENAPSGYIAEYKMFCMRGNVYTVAGMEDIISFVCKNNTNKDRVLESLKNYNAKDYKTAIKNLGMQPKGPYIAFGIILIIIVGGVIIGVLHNKKKKEREELERIKENEEYERIKEKFNKRSQDDIKIKKSIGKDSTQLEQTLVSYDDVDNNGTVDDITVIDTNKEAEENQDEMIENDINEDKTSNTDNQSYEDVDIDDELNIEHHDEIEIEKIEIENESISIAEDKCVDTGKEKIKRITPVRKDEK